LLTCGEADPITLAVTDEGSGCKGFHEIGSVAHESQVFKEDV
jgi:hypothetical protein